MFFNLKDMVARTYSEQLIAEWLELEGYYVKTGVPLQSSTTRGRGEADIVAIKKEKNGHKLLHIEVGHLRKSPKKDLEMVEKKTNAKIKDELKTSIKNDLGVDANYEFRYISMIPYKNSFELIRKAGHRIDLINDVITKEILESIRTYVQDNKKSDKGRKVTPPNNLWMIQLLYRMLYYGVDFKCFFEPISFSAA